MLTGKQKAKVLLSVLGEGAQNILGLLSPESASILTSDVDSAPELNSKELNDFIQEIFIDIENVKNGIDYSGSSGGEFSLDNIDESDSEESSTEKSSFFDDPPVPSTSSTDSEEEKQETEESPVENEEPLPDGIRAPAEIASLLSEQKPQIIFLIY